MSRHYLDGSKRRNFGRGAQARWRRQWERRQSGIKAAGPAFCYSDRHAPLLHNGRKAK